jgi:hypothetical protein
MIAYFFYAPLALTTGILLFYSARGALRGYGRGRLIPLTVALSVSLFGSLYLMFGIDEPWGRWAAVAAASVVVVPILLPVAGILVSVVYAKLTGEPMRWN